MDAVETKELKVIASGCGCGCGCSTAGEAPQKDKGDRADSN